MKVIHKINFKEIIKIIETELNIKFYRLFITGEYVLITRHPFNKLITPLFYKSNPYVTIENPDTITCETNGLELSKKIANIIERENRCKVQIVCYKIGEKW